MGETARLELTEQQLAMRERTLQQRLPHAYAGANTYLRYIGHISASRFMLEPFWRQFTNRSQLDACVGVAPQPYDSVQSQIDQGISKQGNRRVHTQLVGMA